MFPLIEQEPRSGGENLHINGRRLDVPVSVSDFWRWSSSDLLSNTARGVFAEFIVANALGVPTKGIRKEWDPYDLLTSDGIRVEVKSAAYIQSWHQNKLSSISFVIRKRRGWDSKTNLLETEPRRHADVYVFALLAHMDQSTIDPLDLGQWKFYVLSTPVLNERTRSQHSITLRTLETLSGGPVAYGDLLKTVISANGKT